MFDTYWTWPFWSCPLTLDAVASILRLTALQEDRMNWRRLRGYGIASVFRSQRILVGKTPNLTAAVAVG
jgi:CRISPR-associated endonuclease/helicase Cas3